MKIRDLPGRERPRERLLENGAAALSDAELLAILLSNGTKEMSALLLAQALLALDGPDGRGLAYLAACAPEELARVRGIGEAKGCRVAAAMELGKRLALRQKPQRQQITCSSQAAQLFMEDLRYYRKEVLKVLLLNAKGESLGSETVSIGDATGSPADPREIFAAAIKKGAVGLILIHNHPSGDPSPSEDDRRITEQMAAAGKLLHIAVLDHIIIGDGIYISMRDEGIFG